MPKTNLKEEVGLDFLPWRGSRPRFLKTYLEEGEGLDYLRPTLERELPMFPYTFLGEGDRPGFPKTYLGKGVSLVFERKFPQDLPRRGR